MQAHGNQNAIGVTQSLKNVQALLKFIAADGFFISGFDVYLTEYVPLENNHRYYLSGFTGSTGHLFVPNSGKAKLFVDGRYHEQADKETDPELIEVVKLNLNDSLDADMLSHLSGLSLKHIAIEGERTPLKLARQLAQLCEEMTTFDQGELGLCIPFLPQAPLRPISQLAPQYWGRSTREKLQMLICDPSEAIFVSSLDSVAWLTNCRGYHLPNLSSFKAKALATHDRVYVFYDENSKIDPTVSRAYWLEFIPQESRSMVELMSECDLSRIDRVSFDPVKTTWSDQEALYSVFGDSTQERACQVQVLQSLKTADEVKLFEDAFEKSDKAIYNTINWVRESLSSGNEITELQFYKQANAFYKEIGAQEQSFNTISAVGANSSIMHFSRPSAEVKVQNDDLLLLDSGGYYEAGVATDCTRTFLAGKHATASALQKKMYTLVLKGVLQTSMAVFPVGTPGRVLDAFARMPQYLEGWNYAHGTGHGVGVHVHEAGTRLAPTSDLPLLPGQVLSIEPGHYIPGEGGVRLENVVVVEKIKERPGFLQFRSLVHLGYEHPLIDFSLLGPEEIKYFESYEQRCREKGRAFYNEKGRPL